MNISQLTGHPPRTGKDTGYIPLETLDQADLHRALPTRIIRIHSLAKMAALAADNDQTDIGGVGSGMLDLSHPPLGSQHGPLDIHGMSPPPLLDRHIHQTLPMGQDAQVETGEGDAALHDAEVAAGGFEGVGDGFFVGDVDLMEFEMKVLERVLGAVDVEDGDVGSSGEESFHGSRANVSGAAGNDDVGAFEAEAQLETFHPSTVHEEWMVKGSRMW